MGGPSSEYEVSLQSGENIYTALKNHPGFFTEKILRLHQP
jgi:D-alanine-D-alanine ligase-like ATP-grasp enzyme